MVSNLSRTLIAGVASAVLALTLGAVVAQAGSGSTSNQTVVNGVSMSVSCSANSVTVGGTVVCDVVVTGGTATGNAENLSPPTTTGGTRTDVFTALAPGPARIEYTLTSGSSTSRQVVVFNVGGGASAATLIERDDTGLCIPLKPELRETCDELRQVFWTNAGGALEALLRALGVEPTGSNILAAFIDMHVAVGDLRVIEQIAKELGWPAVQPVSVRVSMDAGAEYVEISNVGGATANLDGFVLVAPSGNRFSLEGQLSAGASCRIFTTSTGPAACAGSWAAKVAGNVWPASGANIVIVYEPWGMIAAEWYYTP